MHGIFVRGHHVNRMKYNSFQLSTASHVHVQRFAQQGVPSYLLLLLPEAPDLKVLLEHNHINSGYTAGNSAAEQLLHESAKNILSFTLTLRTDSSVGVCPSGAHGPPALGVSGIRVVHTSCTCAPAHMQLAEQPREALVSDPARTVIAWRQWPRIVRAESANRSAGRYDVPWHASSL
jgi:hypothetical protein